jgi:pyruvate kinase
MNYEIIATLGPASQDAVIWKAMLAAGASAFRLNTSHLSIEQLETWLESLEKFRIAASEESYPIFLDLQGSKWRLGQFQSFALIPGETVELICALSTDRAGCLPVPHQDFFKAAEMANGEIVLNDAKSRLMVDAIQPGRIVARVHQGGDISGHKGITFAACTYRSEALSQKDRSILDLTRNIPSVRYAISYIKDAAEMNHYRSLVGKEPYLAAKLEREPAVDEPQAMAEFANEIWLCRGDLGAELGLVGMAESAARFSENVSELKIPAVMAGQVLEHMTTRPVPTRSEICYLYDSLQKGYAGFVLSDETAIGPHPVESCKVAAMFRTL